MTTNTGQLIKMKYRDRFGSVLINAADEELAKQLPPLGLPYMSQEARNVFRALLQYEKPGANGSLVDVLQLVEARGFSAHPCDWIPEYSWQLGSRPPALYQPWIDWLSEHGLTRFHQGNTLTADNCKRWSPGQRRWALIELIKDGRRDDFEAIKTFSVSQPASVRKELVEEIDAWGAFSGCYPWQTPLLEYFLNDRADAVKALASQKLDKMGVFTTEDSYGRKLATELTVTADSVKYRDPPENWNMGHHLDIGFRCVSFNALATALNLAPDELARRADLEDAGLQVMHVALRSGDVGVRSIFIKRMLDLGMGGEYFSVGLFTGVAQPLWERGLRAIFTSPYVNTVQDFLGSKTGTLDRATIREWRCSQRIPQTVTAELERRSLPVNIQYDDLRVLGKVVNKQVAAEVLKEALAAGMKRDNPRLTMLKLNLAL